MFENLFSWGRKPYQSQVYGPELDLISQELYDNPGMNATQMGYDQTGPLAPSTAKLGTSGLGGTEGIDWFGKGGLLQTGAGLAQGLAGVYMGMKQYGLQKEMFEENKRQYAQNYAAQRGLTNARMEDRQRARVASNAGAYESVGDYMNRHQVR